jgi:dinuclear metal center YbgI/SA1388 family protein
VNLTELVEHLDGYLNISGVPDYPTAYNGLQVEGRADVQKVALAVDASAYAVREAVRQQLDMLIAHHGLLWNDPRPLVGREYQLLAPLFQHGVSVYAAHLPLDAHAEVGNNVGLLRMLGLEPAGSFAPFQGVNTGWWAETDAGLHDVAERLEAALGVRVTVMALGGRRIRRLGVVSGGGHRAIKDAHDAALDALVTGEIPHSAYFDAEELGVNVLLAGHYATETVGVRLLGEHLRRSFGLETAFIDHPTGL